MALELLRLTREAIIQVTMIIKIEESKKESTREPNQIIGNMSLFKFDDEWK